MLTDCSVLSIAVDLRDILVHRREINPCSLEVHVLVHGDRFYILNIGINLM